MLKKILSVLKNKYLLATLIFIVWLVFFDQNNIISQYKKTRVLRNLYHQKEYFLQEIEKNREAAAELESDTASLEKFGRENYLMKKDDEDIYLIIEEE